jgi:hypothetical protein
MPISRCSAHIAVRMWLNSCAITPATVAIEITMSSINADHGVRGVKIRPPR